MVWPFVWFSSWLVCYLLIHSYQNPYLSKKKIFRTGLLLNKLTGSNTLEKSVRLESVSGYADYRPVPCILCLDECTCYSNNEV